MGDFPVQEPVQLAACLAGAKSGDTVSLLLTPGTEDAVMAAVVSKLAAMHRGRHARNPPPFLPESDEEEGGDGEAKEAAAAAKKAREDEAVEQPQAPTEPILPEPEPEPEEPEPEPEPEPDNADECGEFRLEPVREEAEEEEEDEDGDDSQKQQRQHQQHQQQQQGAQEKADGKKARPQPSQRSDDEVPSRSGASPLSRVLPPPSIACNLKRRSLGSNGTPPTERAPNPTKSRSKERSDAEAARAQRDKQARAGSDGAVSPPFHAT